MNGTCQWAPSEVQHYPGGERSPTQGHTSTLSASPERAVCLWIKCLAATAPRSPPNPDHGHTRLVAHGP